jgi:hypothetical protein
MAADVVGYSRLTGRDGIGTLRHLREHHKERLKLEGVASPGSPFARVPTRNCSRQRAMRKLYSEAMINAEAIE